MNTDSPQEDGATIVVLDPADKCLRINSEGMRRDGEHHFIWIHEGSVWTDRVRCTTCGEIRTYTREEL